MTKREELSRYVEPTLCDFVITYVPSPSSINKTKDEKKTPSELQSMISEEFEEVAFEPVIEPSISPALTRAFYIPILSPKYNVFASYRLYRRKKKVINK